jgi:hypothetical protein
MNNYLGTPGNDVGSNLFLEVFDACSPLTTHNFYDGITVVDSGEPPITSTVHHVTNQKPEVLTVWADRDMSREYVLEFPTFDSGSAGLTDTDWHAGTNDFTFSALVTPAMQTSGTILARHKSNVALGFAVDYNVGNVGDEDGCVFLTLFGHSGPLPRQLQTSKSIPVGYSTHVVLVRASKTFTFYLNGTMSGSWTSTDIWDDSTGTVSPDILVLGAHYNSAGSGFQPGYLFPGKIENARVYMSAFSATALQSFSPALHRQRHPNIPSKTFRAYSDLYYKIRDLGRFTPAYFDYFIRTSVALTSKRTVNAYTVAPTTDATIVVLSEASNPVNIVNGSSCTGAVKVDNFRSSAGESVYNQLTTLSACHQITVSANTVVIIPGTTSKQMTFVVATSARKDDAALTTIMQDKGGMTVDGIPRGLTHAPRGLPISMSGKTWVLDAEWKAAGTCCNQKTWTFDGRDWSKSWIDDPSTVSSELGGAACIQRAPATLGLLCDGDNCGLSSSGLCTVCHGDVPWTNLTVAYEGVTPVVHAVAMSNWVGTHCGTCDTFNVSVDGGAWKTTSGGSVDLRGGSSAAAAENVQHVVKAKTACLTQGVKVGTIRIDVATCSANDLGKGDNLFRYGCNAVVGDGFCYFTYQFQDLRYNLESTKQSWQDSEDACVQLGHSCHLSSIHDAAEQQLILDLGVTEDTWIGLNGTMVGGTKTWVFSDGTPFTYTDGWADNEPNSGQLTECAYLEKDQKFKWDDHPRSSKKQSVCSCTNRFAATPPHFGRPADFDKYTLEEYTTTDNRWRA